MIPINIDDKEVLRRTLLELENDALKLSAPLSYIDPLNLDGSNDIQLIADKLREVLDTLNTLSSELNKTTKNHI